MKRKKRVKPVNAKRKKELWKKQYGTDSYVEALHKEGCSVSGCSPTSGSRAKIECAHHPSRGAGGTWRDMAPLCNYHHRVQHDAGISAFEAHYGIDLKAVATAMALEHGHLVTDPIVEGKEFSSDPDEWEFFDVEDF